MYFDPLYLIVMLIGLPLILIPQWYIKHTFKKYTKVTPDSGLTGAEAAKAILKHNGINDKVGIECIPGELTDHYDPRDRVIRLSEKNYRDSSISAISVAAHEVGHALQHKDKYAPLALRSAIFPTAAMGDKLGVMLIFVGFIFMFALGAFGLGKLIAVAGVVLYGAVVLFQFATLPVEFNASSRAIKQLQSLGFVTTSEAALSRKVLNAAALTYVATALYAVLNLLYYLYILFGRRD
ncbi:MAG: zinc metallopeptidase [Cyanobacteriota bacterium]